MSEKNQVPDQLQELIRKNRYGNTSLLSVNPRKGRYCLRGENAAGRSVFIKWNDPEKTEHFEAFLREKAVYEVLAGTGASPMVVSTGGKLLVTELVEEAGTLRSMLLGSSDKAERKTAVLMAFQTYLLFLKGLEERGQSLEGRVKTYDVKGQYDRHLKQLWISGPADAAVRPAERKVNGLRLKLERLKGTPVAEGGKKVLIHGDLHLNNFMLTKDGDLKMIDFEDVSFGLREIELAYLLSQLEALLTNERAFFEELKYDFFRIFDSMMDRSVFDAVYARYRKGALCNSRFSGK